jgi:hypothetical protein
MVQMYAKANALVQVITSKLLPLDDDGPLCRGKSLSSRVEGLQVGADALLTLLDGAKVEDLFDVAGYAVGLL